MAVFARNLIKLNVIKPFYSVVRRTATQNTQRRVINPFFGKYLFLTNTVSSGVLMFVGDLIQQEIEFRSKLIPERYDYERLTKMTIVGFALGPLHHWYYGYLEVFLPGNSLRTVMKKILADQFIASPLFIVAFFYGMGLLYEKSLKETTDELADKAVTVYIADWIVWPPTQFINFYYIKVEYRVLYINVITTIYNVFLSYIKYKKIDHVADPLT